MDPQNARQPKLFAEQIDLPIYVDSTMLTCFRSCGQKFWKEFILGRRPPGLSIDLHAGACFATALETIRRHIFRDKKPFHEALILGHAAFMQAWGEFEIPPHKNTSKTKDRVWEAVEDYFKTYSPLTDHVQPYIASNGEPTLEYTFAIPLEPAAHPQDSDLFAKDVFPLHPSGSPFLYCGRFDMLGVSNGETIPVDEKTSGRSADTNWAESWNLRNQFLGYVWALRQCGLDTSSLLVRGVSILKTKLGQAEALKTYSDGLLKRWHEQLRRDLWRIRRSWNEDYWDYNFGDTCTQYGNCVFMASCQSEQPLLWLQDLEVRSWNPLAKNPVGPSEKKDVF